MTDSTQYRTAWKSKGGTSGAGEWKDDPTLVRAWVAQANSDHGDIHHWVEERRRLTPTEELSLAHGDGRVVKRTVPSRGLIAQIVRTCLDAEIVVCILADRESWDGEGYDVRSDFVVLWKRHKHPEVGNYDFGTHQGCIRRKLRQDPTVDLYYGHYDLGAEEATKDFHKRLFRIC
jgi:hypothetical protein